MLARTQVSIQLREGVTVQLLLTPALYGIAKERGIDLFAVLAGTKGEGKDKTARVTSTVDAYSKLIYCAAILAWEVAAVDNPDAGEFPYMYLDFYTWAWEQPRDFAKTINAAVLALTGHTVREYLDKATGDEPEKKKTPGRLSRWLRRTGKR